MRKKLKKSFEELLIENRISIQEDQMIMDEIEKRLEQRIRGRSINV